MSEDVTGSQQEKGGELGWVVTSFVCLAIVGIGAGLLYYIYTSEPSAERTEATRTTAMLVDVTTADTGTYRPRIEAMGTVQPARDIILRPRVSGKIIDRADAFTPGGFAKAGDTLVEIDEADYRNTLEQRQSELSQARSDLKIEMGRQDVARQEYELLEKELSQENRALVLREPQLEAARAQLEAARAAVEQARLNLNRTSIEAPFDAQIITRNVNVGSQVSAGDNLARLVGLDTYWVETTVPLSELRWLDFPDTPGVPAPMVRIENRSAWPDSEYRMGRLFKLVGTLEDRTRMARVLVSVEDPLLRETTNADSPPLIIGSFVKTHIRGEKLRNVIRLQREYVREDETVWVMKKGELDVRDVHVVYRDADHAYIRGGLEPGEKIVTTNITTVVEGSPLRLNSSEQPSERAEPSNTMDS
jgi:RND family efflux transporter MFP subunit